MQTKVRFIFSETAYATAIVICIAGQLQAQIGGIIGEGIKRGKQAVEDATNDINKAAARVDPTIALRQEYERAQAAAMKSLRKIDPETLQNQIQGAIERPLADAIRRQGGVYDRRTGMIDLRNTAAGKTLAGWIKNFSQGNHRSAEVEEFSVQAKTGLLTVRLYSRHCQSWGTIIPGQGAVNLYDVTQRARFVYSLKNHSGDFDIDFGPLAPKLTSKTYKHLKDGDILAAIQDGTPGAIFDQMHRESRDNYQQKVEQYYARYGKNNVYFSSKGFVNFASPERIGNYAINGVISAGTSVSRQIMHDLEAQANHELPQLTAWLQRRGLANAENSARQLLSGKGISQTHLKFEIIPVRYASRENPLKVATTPWREVDHAAFVIVWSDGTGMPNHKHSTSTHKADHAQIPIHNIGGMPMNGRPITGLTVGR